MNDALRGFFAEHRRIALAFSGGTDSAYLLYAAKACGCDVRAYYLKSPFQPAFEYADSRRMADMLGADMVTIELDVLADDAVRMNPKDRCYHCKRTLFTALISAARADGFDAIMDGTNASDDAADRPGMRALNEMKVLSPLRQCGITKDRVRAYSKAAGLFTHDKPAYACLATRIEAGREITKDLLTRVEASESALYAMGFSDLRVRVMGASARLQLPASQMADAVARRREIVSALSPHFESILLDLKDRG